MGLKKQYRDLKMRVLSSLRDKVLDSSLKSKHINGNALTVNIFDYVELVIIDNRLIFLDNHGYEHSLFSDCYMDDLIDLLD